MSCLQLLGRIGEVDLARAAGGQHELVAGEVRADARKVATITRGTTPPQPKPVA